MLSLKTEHPLWWATVEIIIYLTLFIIITAIVVFALRGPMRQYKSIDLLIFKKLGPFHTTTNNRIMLALTYLGKHNFLVPANLVLIACFLISGWHYWHAFRILIVSLSSLSLMFTLKYLFHRRRPQDPLLNPAKGKSFPSGHAIMSVNFYGLLLYMIRQQAVSPAVIFILSILLIILIFAIGFSRIYLQVHYASDVLAGFIIGYCWFLTSLHIFNRLQDIIKATV